MWGCKVDLKHAYFHLELANALKSYVRMEIGTQLWEFQAACFGLNCLPYLWTQIMKVPLKRWRKRGFQVWVYLDDILLVAQNPKTLAKQVGILLQDLEEAGLQVNHNKSVLDPSQEIQHLGFMINFREGRLEIPVGKAKQIRKELGKLVTTSAMSCRKMAAILGTVRSFLTALPILRAFSDQMVGFVSQATQHGWAKKLLIPASLQKEVRDIKLLIEGWQGRRFQDRVPVRDLHSDSSDWAWGGLDSTSGRQVQEFWREDQILHINVKEIRAAVHTVQALAQPGEMVHLKVDNSVCWAYLRKGGGRLPHLNALVRPLFRWCQENEVQLKVSLVPSADMLADKLSRTAPDSGDYTLNRAVFRQVREKFATSCWPQVDCFASPGNRQLPKYISRWPHHGAWATDALQANLETLQDIYANPPWTLVAQWLQRLRENPHLRCLTVVPNWAGCSWWPQLVKLHCTSAPVILIQPRWGLFQNCLAEKMPPTRWPLLCVLLSGKFWRESKHRLRITHII
jgi:hypothetical protein